MHGPELPAQTSTACSTRRDKAHSPSPSLHIFDARPYKGLHLTHFGHGGTIAPTFFFKIHSSQSLEKCLLAWSPKSNNPHSASQSPNCLQPVCFVSNTIMSDTRISVRAVVRLTFLARANVFWQKAQNLARIRDNQSMSLYRFI